MTRIILWRHGETVFNTQKRFQGQTDVSLNERGINQAINAAKVLATYNPTHIITSDLSRAKITGQKLADILKIDTVTDNRIRERGFGLWEGLTRDEILLKWEKEYEGWCAGIQPENISIESVEQVSERFKECIKYHVQKNPSDSVIVFVGHAGVISKGILSLLGLPINFRGLKILDNCSWTIMDSKNLNEWVLTGHNLSF